MMLKCTKCADGYVLVSNNFRAQVFYNKNTDNKFDEYDFNWVQTRCVIEHDEIH